MLPFTSLSGATSTGPGTTKDLEGAFGQHLMLVATTGSPAALTVDLEGSHDGVNWVVLSSFTIGGTHARLIDWPLRYLRANLSTLSGGSSPTVTATIASL